MGESSGMSYSVQCQQSNNSYIDNHDYYLLIEQFLSFSTSFNSLVIDSNFKAKVVKHNATFHKGYNTKVTAQALIS